MELSCPVNVSSSSGLSRSRARSATLATSARVSDMDVSSCAAGRLLSPSQPIPAVGTRDDNRPAPALGEHPPQSDRFDRPVQGSRRRGADRGQVPLTIAATVSIMAGSGTEAFLRKTPYSHAG